MQPPWFQHAANHTWGTVGFSELVCSLHHVYLAFFHLKLGPVNLCSLQLKSTLQHTHVTDRLLNVLQWGH